MTQDDNCTKIYPLIVYEPHSGKAKELTDGKIPICPSKIDCNTKQTCCEEAGSLQQLKDELKDYIETANQESNGQVKYELRQSSETKKYLQSSLQDLLKNLDKYPSYERIVICCPLHYSQFNHPLDNEHLVVKLLYEFEMEDLQGSEEVLEQLRNFYKEYDELERHERGIRLYQKMRSVALTWLRFIQAKTGFKRKDNTSQDLLRAPGGF